MSTEADEQQLIKLSIQDLNRVHITTQDQSAKDLSEGLIWDLTCLFTEEARKVDGRSIDEVRTALKETGKDRLESLAGLANGREEKFQVASARAMLSVGGLIEEREQSQNWQQRVAPDAASPAKGTGRS